MAGMIGSGAALLLLIVMSGVLLESSGGCLNFHMADLLGDYARWRNLNSFTIFCAAMEGGKRKWCGGNCVKVCCIVFKKIGT